MDENAAIVEIKVEDAEENGSRKSLIELCQEGNAELLKSRLEQISIDEKEKLLNTKNKEGTTPLHESCCYGKDVCTSTLLESGADAIMYDMRGFSPIHCAAYNGHIESIQVLLKWKPPIGNHTTKCEVNTKSQYDETALHIACFRGHLNVARFLIDENHADLSAIDKDKNTVLHYATSSNNGSLLTWLLRMSEVKEMINDQNKFGQTAAHRAAVLGCVMSVSVLFKFGAGFDVKDKAGHSALDLARLLSNTQCYEIASGNQTPLKVTDTPPSKRGSFFLSNDNLTVLQPQRSNSNGSAVSASITSGSPQTLKRHGSITKRNRPISQFVSRRSSFHTTGSAETTIEMGHRRSSSSRGSLTTMGSLSGHGMPLTGRDSIASIASLRGSTDNFRYTSKETLSVVEEKEKKSKSCEEMEMKLLFASSYEPPPDLHFIPPLECNTLTREDSQLYSELHNIFLRIPADHWKTAKDKQVEVRICATMGLNQYPDNYVIVSPVCFISCRSKDNAVIVRLKLPHAASIKTDEYRNKVFILSTMSTVVSKNPTTPLFTPTDRKLHPIDVTSLEFDVAAVDCTLKLLHPALFAVAIACSPGSMQSSIPIPLRCQLYVLFKIHDGKESLGRVYVYAYVAMNLKTVETDMKALSSREEQVMERHGFELNSPSVQVSATLRNPESWEVTPMNNGLFGYHQVALSSQSIYMNQNTNSYSHDHPYPLQQRFFIEPKTARGAIKCDVTVSDALHQQLASCLVLPYSPTSKDTTPEPSRAANASSIPSSQSSTCPPSPTGNHHSFHSNRLPPVAGAMNYLRSDDIGTMV